jgi:tRNA(fMet)-specific endonuclease VapC
MLDTNTCIFLINRRSPKILERLRSHFPGDVGISSVSYAELRFGAEKSANRHRNIEALERFLIPLELAEFEERAAISYGVIREGLERAGILIGPLDTLIGAHALSISAILVTNNVREFQRIPLLRWEDWT